MSDSYVQVAIESKYGLELNPRYLSTDFVQEVLPVLHSLSYAGKWLPGWVYPEAYVRASVHGPSLLLYWYKNGRILHVTLSAKYPTSIDSVITSFYSADTSNFFV